jgi:immune inhibitor A
VKRLIFILLVSVFVLNLSAQNAPARVPAAPYPIDFVQPDGDTLTIRLVGDEWHHFTKTCDGFVVCENARGFYCYAKVNCKGEVVASRRVARNADKRTRCDERYLERMKKNEKLYRP